MIDYKLFLILAALLLMFIAFDITSTDSRIEKLFGWLSKHVFKGRPLI